MLYRYSRIPKSNEKYLLEKLLQGSPVLEMCEALPTIDFYARLRIHINLITNYVYSYWYIW